MKAVILVALVALVALVVSGCATEEEPVPAPASLCGNGKIDTGEECDDSDQDDFDECRNGCRLARCGDGIIRKDMDPDQDGFEACDDGESDSTQCNYAGGAWPHACTVASCGDGYKNVAANEACDEGPNGSDTCADDCRSSCGDGACNGTESATGCPQDCGSDCGDGVCNGSDTTANCPADCWTCVPDCSGSECGPDPVCGINCGTCAPGTSCDDWGWCEPDSECGDGIVDDDEECDDGNIADDDGCDSSCALEDGWALVPGGTYTMGCSPGDDGCRREEKPPHEVTVSAFLMMATEVTQERYEDVMDVGNPSHHTGCPTCPVENITWDEAKAFCTAIGARLPSEAEWEYAARGGTTTQRYCDETADENCLDDIAWYKGNSGDATHTVGEKTANAYGLYDMLGNVEEWNEDCWHKDYTGAPIDGGVWEKGHCRDRVLRGGSWHSDARETRALHRKKHNPDHRHDHAGARCVRSGSPCGNGELDDGEQCDDGNTADDDGCDSSCVLEVLWAEIPGGTYMMGCSSGDQDCHDWEKPPHEVTVSPFRMMETEITQAQYESIMDDNPSYHTDCPTCPVEEITWDEANAFCAALGARLPSEAEWEYAARGGTTTRRYCDETADENCLDDIAWYDGNSGYESHPVGGQTPNAYGLYDMLGNVFEWNEDCWHWSYDDAPDDGGVWPGGYCEYRVVRGGSWLRGAEYSRASYRFWIRPEDPLSHRGARCAR